MNSSTPTSMMTMMMTTVTMITATTAG